MAHDLRIKSELLAPLAAMAYVQQGGGSYYGQLRKSSDPVLAVGAWCGLLDGKLVGHAFWDELAALGRYEAIRSRAYTYFEDLLEHELARKVATTDVVSRSGLEQALMLADLDRNAAAAAEAEGGLYLATGDIEHVLKASARAETGGGWRAGLAWALRAILIAPLAAVPVQRLFVVLESSGQPDLLQEVAEIFVSRNLNLPVAQVFLAGAAYMRGDAELCLAKLRPLDDAKVAANKLLAPYSGAIRTLRAQAKEKLGHYKQAYEGYVALNDAERDRSINPDNFYKGIEVRGRLAIPALPPDEHPDVVQMLGFPRSGTTLLENALAAHPQIETFEEIPGVTVAIDRIERVLLGKVPPEPPEVTFAVARQKYYGEVESRRHKAGATVLVDKMPIRSADAAFISKLFPEWRYIFSIRHPYDVILSCFKQRFLPNPAMENFRSIAAASRLYDQTMTEWFNHHTLHDPAVHYVRYDQLVTDFDRVAGGTLDFLGVPWDDKVRDFSKSAEKRAAMTPSYQKVRQGLSIGVQTAWRNYGFVFQSDAAKPLRKWVEFFGYEAE